jgi:hypothetical protein
MPERMKRLDDVKGRRRNVSFWAKGQGQLATLCSHSACGPLQKLGTSAYRLFGGSKTYDGAGGRV